MSKFNAYRNAEFVRSYVWPMGTDLSGYTGIFRIYDALGGTILLSVTLTPNENNSRLIITDNAFSVDIEAVDVAALGVDSDPTQPKVMYFDFVIFTPDNETRKIDGGPFLSWPWGSDVKDECCEITVNLCCGETTLQVVPYLTSEAVLKTGGTMTGPLELYGDPQGPLEAVPLQYLDDRVGPLGSTDTIVILNWGQSNATILATGNDQTLIPVNTYYIYYGMTAPALFTSWSAAPFSNKAQAGLQFAYQYREAHNIPASQPILVLINSLGGETLAAWVASGRASARYVELLDIVSKSSLTRPVDVVYGLQGERDSTTEDTGYSTTTQWNDGYDALQAQWTYDDIVGPDTQYLHAEMGQWFDGPAETSTGGMKVREWLRRSNGNRAIVSSAGLIREPGSANTAHYSGAAKDEMGRRAAAAIFSPMNFGRPIGVQSAVSEYMEPEVITPPLKYAGFTIGSATINSGGTGYTVSDVLTLVGGTYGNPDIETPGTLTVTSVSGGVITGVTNNADGRYQALPAITGATVTGGSGAGATFDLTAGTPSTPVDVFLGTDNLRGAGGINVSASTRLFLPNAAPILSAVDLPTVCTSTTNGTPRLLSRQAIQSVYGGSTTGQVSAPQYDDGTGSANYYYVDLTDGTYQITSESGLYKVCVTGGRFLNLTAAADYTLQPIDYENTIIRAASNHIKIADAPTIGARVHVYVNSVSTQSVTIETVSGDNIRIEGPIGTAANAYVTTLALDAAGREVELVYNGTWAVASDNADLYDGYTDGGSITAQTFDFTNARGKRYSCAAGAYLFPSPNALDKGAVMLYAAGAITIGMDNGVGSMVDPRTGATIVYPATVSVPAGKWVEVYKVSAALLGIRNPISCMTS
ncbi:MAG: hypothetical protein NVV72_15800 [Asticcacaulis sp.]|nr:hypothetical protein [Asticcacaulis sp.]